MKVAIKLFEVSRSNIRKLVDGVTLEQVNEIPEGLNNNIAWHIGHLVSSHNGLIYGLAGIDKGMDTGFIEKYKKGSKPESPINKEEFDYIKSMLMQQVVDLEKDLEDGIFKTSKAYMTSYNFEITNIEEAVQFNNLHQALHITTVIAIGKRVWGSVK